MTHNNEKPHGNTLGPMAPPTDHLAAAKYVYMGQQLATIQWLKQKQFFSAKTDQILCNFPPLSPHCSFDQPPIFSNLKECSPVLPWQFQLNQSTGLGLGHITYYRWTNGQRDSSHEPLTRDSPWAMPFSLPHHLALLGRGDKTSFNVNEDTCCILRTTRDRRLHLKFSKYFDCSCRRCSDPTELGTFLSSIKCPKVLMKRGCTIRWRQQILAPISQSFNFFLSAQ